MLISRKIPPTRKILKFQLNASLREKSVGTTELHYSRKKRYHVLTILKSFFFVRHSSEYETSAINFGSPFGRYPTFHTLTSVGRKKSLSVWLKHGTAFSCCSGKLVSCEVQLIVSSS